MLVGLDGEHPAASRLLLNIQHGEGDTLYITGYMARANQQWRTFNPEQEVLAICPGQRALQTPGK